MDNSYSGPCVVFIISKNELVTSEKVYIKSGLGCINEGKTDYKFFFKTSNGNDFLEVVPIGNKESKDSNRKNIYQLVKGESQVPDYAIKLKTIRFFIGTPREFSEWNMKYIDELEYLKNKGINWQDYYNKILIAGN